MGLYEPKSCCICFDTKTGSLILASLSLVGSILFILSVVSGHLGVRLDTALDHLVQSHALDLQDKNNFILYVCIAVLVKFAFLGLFSILLIHGIRKDRPGLMLPYLILHRFYIAMYMILIVTLAGVTGFNVVAIGIGSHRRAFFSLHHNIYFHIVALIFVTIKQIYFQLVITAYHKQVKCALSKDYFKFNNDGTDSMMGKGLRKSSME